MGLVISVYRNSDGDCTKNGVSSQFSELTVVNIMGPSEPTEARPGVYLVPGVLPGTARVVPVKGRWVMFGGNYASTSDSRFREAVEKITKAPFYGAIAIHDRIE